MRKKFTYFCDYIVETMDGIVNKISPIHANVLKDEVVESIADDIQRCDGDLWYNVNKHWFTLRDFRVVCRRKQYDAKHRLIKEEVVTQYKKGW